MLISGRFYFALRSPERLLQQRRATDTAGVYLLEFKRATLPFARHELLRHLVVFSDFQ